MRMLFSFVCPWILWMAAATGAFAQAPAESELKAELDRWRAMRPSDARQAMEEKLLSGLIDFGNTDDQKIEAKAADMADEIARQGAPKNELTLPASGRSFTLKPLRVLTGAREDDNAYPKISPIFRRISPDRVEAWDPKDGWLFNARGKLLAQARVPRRDGTGREWYGAFLPDGRWITTDLWDNDRQLNGFSKSGKWLWELPARRILALAPPLIDLDTNKPPDVTPSVAWARADRTGKRWLVELGTEMDRSYAFVLPGGKVQHVPDVSIASLAEPRSMGVFGYFIEYYAGSDDGDALLDRSCVGHGKDVPWPTYTPGGRIYEGDKNIGFWPGSHAFYIETDRRPDSPREVWFFNEKNQYEGQAQGAFLGDGAKPGTLLIQSEEGAVFQMAHTPAGLAVTNRRQFQWPDGTAAIPLTIYDDWKLGFFLRPSGAEKSGDSPEEKRAEADVVLAAWSE